LPVVCIIILEGVRYIIDKSVPCVTQKNKKLTGSQD